MKDGTKVIKIWLNKEVYEKLYKEGLLKSEDYQLIAVEPYNEAYPDDPQWAKLKSEADKSYKKLKERAFELRDTEEWKTFD